MKKTVAILYGGASVEHEISIRSASSIFKQIDRTLYEPVLFFIDKSGNWFLNKNTSVDILTNLNALEIDMTAALGEHFNIAGKNLKLDVVFSVLHGTLGEDGSIPGLLNCLKIPFVSPSVMASANCMNKGLTKRLLKEAGVASSGFVVLHKRERTGIELKAVITKLGLPLMVKPCNLGSSVGVTKVKLVEDLLPALDEVFKYDNEALIEEFIDGRELECSVKGNSNPVASVAGEVIVDLDKYEFYDYKAKYTDPNGAITVIPAEVDEITMEEIKRSSVAAYEALNCEVLSRIDLFLTKEGEVLVNEVNTLPGFTDISMFAKLWEAEGISYQDLLTELIGYSLQRWDEEQELSYSYDQ